eukprot:CAMPEP_0119380430 /NCGR_PEP_ID=MMETSP1334-20130426/56970_1 /TAXON_ID=127549 /ORGANISM="Calcidiscus leptoporus, Strain RCC1130" /LENGTH=52 /DNA_ID=CAMNT_0007400255 /DNA_START=366 /DNA_END=520 /DNA_ORIENTATION=+
MRGYSPEKDQHGPSNPKADPNDSPNNQPTHHPKCAREIWGGWGRWLVSEEGG